jgi:hypothetical protein
VPVNTSVTLTTGTTCDIGPTPYYLEIFDAINNVYVTGWGAGSSFSTAVTQPVAGTHGYVAVLYSPFSLNSPPPNGVSPTTWGISATIYITWTAPLDNFQVSLSGPTFTPPGGAPGLYTATVNQDVGPTPYYIEIFDETTVTRLALCGYGSTCQASFTPSTSGDYLVAFVSSASTALPPPPTQANTAVLTTIQV